MKKTRLFFALMMFLGVAVSAAPVFAEETAVDNLGDVIENTKTFDGGDGSTLNEPVN